MLYLLKMRMRSDTEYHSRKNIIRKSINSKSIGKTLIAQSWISKYYQICDGYLEHDEGSN
mgnify:CR=1 FL=1